MIEVGKCYTIPDDIAKEYDLIKDMVLEITEVEEPFKDYNGRICVQAGYIIHDGEDMKEVRKGYGSLTVDFWVEIKRSNKYKLKQGLLKEGL